MVGIREDTGDTVALQRLVDTALNALLALQEISDANIPPYDEARMTMEFELCAEWFAQKLIKSPLGPADAQTLADARASLLHQGGDHQSYAWHPQATTSTVAVRGGDTPSTTRNSTTTTSALRAHHPEP